MAHKIIIQRSRFGDWTFYSKNYFLKIGVICKIVKKLFFETLRFRFNSYFLKLFSRLVYAALYIISIISVIFPSVHGKFSELKIIKGYFKNYNVARSF